MATTTSVRQRRGADQHDVAVVGYRPVGVQLYPGWYCRSCRGVRCLYVSLMEGADVDPIDLVKTSTSLCYALLTARTTEPA